MRTLGIVVMGGLVVLLLTGCADKQDEAARLEQEMRDLEAADTTAGDTTGSDTVATLEAMADAGAVPEEPVPENLPMPPAPRGEGYTVQVASCENDEYAGHLIEVYTGRGYEAFVSTITFEGQTYFRVRIGNFDNLADARALKEELIDRYSLSPWIDRLDQ